MLEIKVFGELEVRRGKRVVALPASKKSRALLAYLVVTARPHLREALCDLLWIGPDDPRAALRWSLTKIRGVVDTRLVADRERVSFEPGSSTTIDLVTARSLVAADVTAASIDALKRAAELTRGELLEGLDLVDCYRFHEWCVGEREAARALRVSILATLASRLEDTPEEALAVARARVAVDPLSEAAHEAVIRILGKLGKKREALAQFDTCRRILQTELGAKPSASLLHARATLAPQTGASETPPPPARATPPRDAALLVGRKVERDEIAARVRGAAAHVAQPFLLFAGEAGIGKTRLLEVCGDAMRAAGGAVLAGRAFEAESVRPYGPWIDALSGARVPDPLGPAGAPAAQDQRRLFDAVGELVSGLAARAPLAILLDDLQWFDEASLALLHALSRSLPPHVLFVCAARPAELADNVIAQRLVHALTRESRLVRHDLTPLAEAEVTELATALGAAAEGARIFGESGGHPFFAVEIARALARGDAALPPTLTALIDDRLSRLGALAKSLLPWAAAMRRGFELDVLARATNLPASEVLEGARELEAHRVLEERAVGGGYDFAHDLLRSATYRKLSEPRRRWIHLQLARALSSGGGGASEIAHHAGLGGDHELAARAALDAAQAALRVFANGEAASLGRLGVEHAASLPRDTRLPLQVGLLDVVVHSGAHSSRPRELEDEVLRVVTECEAAGLGALASAGLHTLAVAQRDRGGVESAFANAVRASEVHETTDPGARALRLSATAKCLMHY